MKLKQLPVLETERFILTVFNEEDISVIARTCNTKICQRYMTAPFPYSEQDAKEFIKTANRFDEGVKKTEITWAIRKKQSADKEGKKSDICGTVALRQTGTVGFWVSEESRGKGVIPEALRAVLNWASDSGSIHGLSEVEWDGGRVNISSARAAMKTGFTFVQFQKYQSVTNFNLDLTRYLPYNDSRMVAKWNLDNPPATDAQQELAQKSWPPLVRFGGKWAGEMDAFLDGEIENFSDLGTDFVAETKLLAMAGCSEFQTAVLLKTAQITRGNVKTYAEIAAEVGHTGASRAVGSALKNNPYPVLIPCHRVVRADSIGEYALGVEAKMRLLKLEGALPHML